MWGHSFFTHPVKLSTSRHHCPLAAKLCTTLGDPWLRHTRFLCPPLSPRICSNSCPLSWWCHPTNSSSVAPFSSCPHCFPESGSFLVSQLFPSGSQSIGAPVSASVIPMNIQGWFPLELTGLISLKFRVLSILLQHHNSKPSVLHCSAYFMIQLSHLYIITGKSIVLTIWTFIKKVMALLFNASV